MDEAQLASLSIVADEPTLKPKDRQIMASERSGAQKYAFEVDKQSYEVAESVLTGAQIKALIHNFPSSHQLVMERLGKEPDKVVENEDAISLIESHRPIFYTVPPATFGQINSIFVTQYAELRTRHPSATRRNMPSGAILVTVSQVLLPNGWNTRQTDVRFVVPNGYPFSQPDCFWTTPGLKLENGLAAQGTSNRPIPEIDEPGTWFSWHAQQWNPNTDTLLGFFRLVERRLANPQ